MDKDNLVRVLRDLRKMDEHARPAIENLLHRSRLVKLDEYLDFETERGVDRVHRLFPVVKMTGTKTLRFAYADPPIHSWADEIRGVVCAPPGKVFVAGDWSALEARIFAILTNDQIDLAVYDKGGDIHLNTALEMFGLAELPTVKRKAYRNTAKTFRFGVLQYGGEPETLKAKTYCPCPRCRERLPDSLSLSREELRKVTDRWFARHPNVRKWRSEVVAQVRKSRSYVAPSGLRRFYLAPMGEELWKEAWNWPIQHLAAWLAHRAQRRLHEKYDAPIVLQHHDSLVCMVDEGSEVTWGERLREVMEMPVPELGGRVFPIEVKHGQRWSEL